MPSSSPLLTLIGRMKVGQLATLTGLGVEELVAIVLGSTPARPPRPTPNPSPPPADTVGAALPSPAEPPLAALFGRVTYHELHRVLDRWLLDRTLEEHRGNVTHAAARLGITRLTLRRHRARARSVRLDQWQAVAPTTTNASAIPEPPSVLAVLADGSDYRRIRDAVDRWLLGATLAREHGNITQAARSLGMSRKDLRVRWKRLRG